ncbi:MAG: EAL domain-containing protein [Planctomycetes bacterium]|nr:EAL domain-containing protein [Planctomycetota bacterium]
MQKKISEQGINTVLLIEDEPGDALLIRLQLQESHDNTTEVVTCSSLAEAERWLTERGSDPDVVLLDLNLTDSTGPETVKRCRQLTAAPIVVLTGLDDSAASRVAIESGAEDYLTKGSDAQSVQRAIEFAILRHLREADARLAMTVFAHAREAITMTDVNGTILEVNDSFSRITGYDRDEVIGQNPRILRSGRHDDEFYSTMWDSLLSDGYWEGEIWNRRKDGEVYAEHLTISAVRDVRHRVHQYVALFTDITAQKEHEAQLRHIAHYDTLTGLANRTLLADRLHQVMARSRRWKKQIAVAYIDLDGFKGVNDTHGHEVGDKLLIAIAERMTSSVREEDTISRLGGDEFIALLTDFRDNRDCEILIYRLLSACSEPLSIDGLTLQVSASIGISFYPQPIEIEPDQLIRQADQAMYQAKLEGKNRFFEFDHNREHHVRNLHREIEAIKQALENDEFTLHYQPQVNMRTGEVLGVEALIRWQHPQQGLLPPGQFLPAVERDRFAVEIDYWVLERVFQQLQVWQHTGLEIVVSVNLSGRTLHTEGFLERVNALVAYYPTIKPAQIKLEVLESTALDDIPRVSQLICQCNEIGIGFSLDDFGTGYSSLTYLKRLPASQIKIDQSFVRDMLSESDDLAIIEAIIGLSSAFCREVIAEGVESLEHGEVLISLGCELAQGYQIARPMPADELPAWVEQWRPPEMWQKTNQLSQEMLPMLYAEVDHRVWLDELRRYLWQEGETHPELDGRMCRFGAWFQHQSQALKASLDEAEQCHTTIHELGRQLVAQAADGEFPDKQLIERIEHLSQQLTHDLNKVRRHHAEPK